MAKTPSSRNPSPSSGARSSSRRAAPAPDPAPTIRDPQASQVAPASEVAGSAQSSMSGPTLEALADHSLEALPTQAQRDAASRMVGAQALARAMPFNAAKAAEYGREGALNPPGGQSEPPADTNDTASTLGEGVPTPKQGERGAALTGVNANDGTLDRVRADATGQALTTNQGVPIADNQNSLKAGLRGPTLMEDFILREKITHFDHERIPERVVHARGSAAHGYFEAYEALADLTCAAPFAAAGKRTPVFVRFSTVVGERGSTDTARDVRGFAVKFYTDEGNWDLVGNNIPVFFIQDAMKFPDLVHAAKPEPHHQMPQAATAHDTFWDFAGLMPEITHMLLWTMSDRAIPRSYRMMQGFGVHTFRLVNEAGDSVLCKFHWTPTAGTHSLVWDEAAKISGADPDFHRRDLWEAIEAGAFPEWELGLQVFTEAPAETFSFDVLDATKIVPEELVPIRAVGRLVLNRNPDNFFAETEQVAFCTANVVRGIGFTNDPLLQGRNHSYVDTQISRLGGPNFHEIPINGPVSPVHNNQRDGMHRQAIHRGRVNYEPNSLGGGCPFQAGLRGYRTVPQPTHEDTLRGKPEKFADHFSQARLFWKSQTPTEQAHIVGAFRFELTRVQVPAVRERIVALLLNVDTGLASRLASGLGMELPPAQPAVGSNAAGSEIDISAALSLFARPGDGSVKTRRVALLVADGVEAQALRLVHAGLSRAGAVPRYVGPRLGQVTSEQGEPIVIETTLEAAPSVLWDAVVVPDGEAAQAALLTLGQAVDFVKEQYRHCKPMLVLGAGTTLLEAAGIPLTLPSGHADPGLIVVAGMADGAQRELGESMREGRDDGDLERAMYRFGAALARHRVFEREIDPPPV
jgi:catalase